jgi:hypothetical protein
MQGVKNKITYMKTISTFLLLVAAYASFGQDMITKKGQQ